MTEDRSDAEERNSLFPSERARQDNAASREARANLPHRREVAMIPTHVADAYHHAINNRLDPHAAAFKAHFGDLAKVPGLAAYATVTEWVEQLDRRRKEPR